MLLRAAAAAAAVCTHPFVSRPGKGCRQHVQSEGNSVETTQHGEENATACICTVLVVERRGVPTNLFEMPTSSSKNSSFGRRFVSTLSAIT